MTLISKIYTLISTDNAYEKTPKSINSHGKSLQPKKKREEVAKM